MDIWFGPSLCSVSFLTADLFINTDLTFDLDLTPDLASVTNFDLQPNPVLYLHLNPDLWLSLDLGNEPSASLDSITGDLVLDLIFGLHKDGP